LPVQHVVDRITAWFVPVVLGIAAVTFTLWLAFGPGLAEALVPAISVLIIACPCAMGLAVPVSILVGTGRGAQLGVLIRDGAALQRLSRIDTIAFDKTGTLTQGTPVVDSVLVARTEVEAQKVLAQAAQVARASEHVYAKAIAAHAGPGPVAQGVTAHPGQGAEGSVAGQAVRIGQAGFVEPGAVREMAMEAARMGAGLVYVSEDGVCIGAITLRDQLRDSTAQTLTSLRAEGIDIHVLTGDTPEGSAAVLEGQAITQIAAGLSPRDKAEHLAQLAETGRKVAFVGDGINDAPALAAAEVGIAMGGGTDVAIEAADVVLMRADPMAAATALHLGRKTMGNIRQNLGWAFGYNVALIPVAAGVLSLFGGPMLSPMLAAAAMALSSLLVVGNALRLRRVKA
ncbi:MAG: heavy metal translocating P-type ATPase, partial [Pseudomonadota bacterium]